MKKWDIKKTLMLILICVLTIAMVVLLVAFIKGLKAGAYRPSKNPEKEAGLSAQSSGKLFDGVEPVKEDVVISTKIISDGLKSMGILITEEYYFTQMEEYTDTKSWYFLSSTSSFKYSYDGCVTAGIDCSKVAVDKDEDNKVITITVPKAEIQQVSIDFDSFQMLEEKTGLWNKMSMANYNESLAEFERAAREKAVEKGIVDKANESAVLLIKNAVESFVDTQEYRVEFQQ